MAKVETNVKLLNGIREAASDNYRSRADRNSFQSPGRRKPDSFLSVCKKRVSFTSCEQNRTADHQGKTF